MDKNTGYMQKLQTTKQVSTIDIKRHTQNLRFNVLHVCTK